MASVLHQMTFLSTVFAFMFQGCLGQNFSWDTSTCLVDSAPFTIYGWVRPDEGLQVPYWSPPVHKVQHGMQFITATIVTTIDTVNNSSRVTTSLPPGWTPPPTNAAGTQTNVLTLDSTTITLTFPSVYIQWPEQYWYCERGTEADSYKDCPGQLGTRISTALTTLPPQPTKAMNLAWDSGLNSVELEELSDPKGLLAMPVQVKGVNAWQPPCSVLLSPYYPGFECFDYVGGFPVWGGLDTTWMDIVTSTATI